MISQMTPAGASPAMRDRSTAASVWPARTSTPPSRARSGKTWPGRAKSAGRQCGSITVRMVRVRSDAEIPVVTPARASMDSQNAVPKFDVLVGLMSGSRSWSQRSGVRARQMRPRPWVAMKLMISGVTFSAAMVRSPSFSRSSSSTTTRMRPARISSMASSTGTKGMIHCIPRVVNRLLRQCGVRWGLPRLLPFSLALPRLTATGIIDILVVAFLVYQALLVVRGTRAGHILAGLFIVISLYTIASWAGLEALRSVLSFIVPYIGLAVIVLFQSEIRRTLARLGRKRWLGFGGGRAPESVHEILLAVERLSEHKTGALIVLERDIGLRTFIESGVPLEAHLSSDLLLSIFHPGLPL